MQLRQLTPILLAFLGSLVVAGIALAQASPNFDLSWFTLASSGGVRQSPNYVVEDSFGQWAGDVATASSTQLLGGFVPGVGVSDAVVGGDGFEADNNCSQATALSTAGSKQTHTFHAEGDQDWLKFTAQANKTYVIEVTNLGAKSDAIIVLHNTCDEPPASQGNNSFGSTVRLEWDSVKNGDYFIEIQQFDPSFFGDDANYEVAVTVDNVPPSAPQNLRCVAINSTTLGLQWKESPNRDVTGYRIAFTGTPSGNDDVAGAETTYYELGGLLPDQSYALRARALDYSGNESAPSGEVQCTATSGADPTQPAFNLAQPAGGSVYTTTAGLLTFTGNAQDAGNNLSRVQVRNLSANLEGWDYSLTGGTDEFRVSDLSLSVGDNNVNVAVYDTAGNVSQQAVTVRRLGQAAGAVLIIAGHNETFGLQSNIYNAANRTYRIFRSAGFSDDSIFYLAPVGQDANGDGAIDSDAATSPAAIQQAITVWAATRVNADKPLFVYMIDHGLAEKFCASGCAAGGHVTSKDMNDWLTTLEQTSGLTQTTVVIEACQSGSFIDRPNGDVANSLGAAGRVIITATGRENNAYASAQGAYFSDAFFSCIADSNHLKACFDQASAAVRTTGVNQTPWLDDNGDGLSDSNDGTLAAQRIVTRFFSSIRPQITGSTLALDNANGTLVATIEDGAEETELVWAAVYPPGFQEPDGVTLNLNVPTVRLEPDPTVEGRYSFAYVNGFSQTGEYRIVFYAQDRLGIHAVPKRLGEAFSLFLPVINKE